MLMAIARGVSLGFEETPPPPDKERSTTKMYKKVHYRMYKKFHYNYNLLDQ